MNAMSMVSAMGFMGMMNDEWRMENGEWRMENGEWRMENGEWKKEAWNLLLPISLFDISPSSV